VLTYPLASPPKEALFFKRTPPSLWALFLTVKKEGKEPRSRTVYLLFVFCIWGAPLGADGKRTKTSCFQIYISLAYVKAEARDPLMGQALIKRKRGQSFVD
jgi:hypothetical protein